MASLRFLTHLQLIQHHDFMDDIENWANESSQSKMLLWKVLKQNKHDNLQCIL